MANREYVKQREKLIPSAVRWANQKHGELPKDTQNSKLAMQWSRTMSLEMDRLAVEAGLVEPWTVGRGWISARKAMVHLGLKSEATLIKYVDYHQLPHSILPSCSRRFRLDQLDKWMMDRQ